MGFFACISRRPKAVLEPLQKRDSAADRLPVKVRILTPRSPGEAAGSGRKWQGAGELLEEGWQQFGIFGAGGHSGRRAVSRILADLFAGFARAWIGRCFLRLLLDIGRILTASEPSP